MDEMIDTHAHLYLDRFDEEREAMLQRTFEAGVKQIYLPHIDSGTTERLLKLEADYPDRCKAMMGLHPCSVNASVEEELANVEKHIRERRFAAIGEIGIDLYWDDTYYSQQEEAFRRQIAWAKELGLPIVIHCRNAFDEVYEVLKDCKDDKLYGIFHCFAGSLEQAQKLLDLDFMLGIGGIVTFKNGGLDKVVPHVPLEKLVLETDSPFLAPVPYRGKRNESSYIPYIAARVAALQEKTVEEVARVTTASANKIFAY